MPKDTLQIDEPFVDMYSGTRMYLLDPQKDNVNIADIARALSALCCHNGSMKHFYARAQRAVMASHYAEAYHDIEHARMMLFWSASDVYTGALPYWMRQRFPEFVDISTNVNRAIFEHLNLDPDMVNFVSLRDICAAVASVEHSQLRGHIEMPMTCAAEASDRDAYFKPVYMHVSEIYQVYVARFRELFPEFDHIVFEHEGDNISTIKARLTGLR